MILLWGHWWPHSGQETIVSSSGCRLRAEEARFAVGSDKAGMSILILLMESWIRLFTVHHARPTRANGFSKGHLALTLAPLIVWNLFKADSNFDRLSDCFLSWGAYCNCFIDILAEMTPRSKKDIFVPPLSFYHSLCLILSVLVHFLEVLVTGNLLLVWLATLNEPAPLKSYQTIAIE